MLADIPNSSNSTVITQANQLIDTANGIVLTVAAMHKSAWTSFWDQTQTVDAMQSQLDLMASTPAVDLGQPTNVLSAFFAKGTRLVTFLLNEDSTIFGDARKDATGSYQQYITSGWYYTIDGAGRMIVSSPVVWV